MENHLGITITKKSLSESEQDQVDAVNEIEADTEPDIDAESDSKNEIHTVLAKIMEEKHTYTYKKLVVPMSMRSIYWKFFGFPATDDGDILTKVKIVCIICKTQIAYNRNTSNLRMHLQNKHAQELHELEAASPPRKQVLTQESKDRRAQKRMLKAALAATGSQHIYATNMDGTVQIDGDIQFVTDPNISLSGMDDNVNSSSNKPLRVMIKNGSIAGASPAGNNQNIAFLVSDDNMPQQQQNQSTIDGKTVSDAIAEFIIMDLQLPEVVEGRGFQRLVATLRSPCEIPSKSKLEDEIIPRIYDTFKESIAASFACLTSEVSLAVEEWRSNSGETFFTFLIFYQNPGEIVLESKILNTVHAPLEWDEMQWGNVIDSMLVEWEIKLEKITAVVVGTSRTELLNALATRNMALVPCLLHTLQICAQACFENPDVAVVLSKCRAAIGTITNHPDAAAALAMQEQLLEVRSTFGCKYTNKCKSYLNKMNPNKRKIDKNNNKKVAVIQINVRL